MSKWIDADALEYDTEWSEYHDGFTAYSQMAIDTAPSIDIVRCKECIWRDKDNQGEGYCTYVKGLADINEDSFCSWGERSRR